MPRSSVDRCASCGVARRSHSSDHVFIERTSEERDQDRIKDLTFQYLDDCGLVPTEDAVEQMSQVFLKCAAIMCQRGYAKDGGTWKKAGRLGILHDVRKKFERAWWFYWTKGEEHPDSLIDLINFAGMALRAPDPRYGEWGEPAPLLRTFDE